MNVSRLRRCAYAVAALVFATTSALAQTAEEFTTEYDSECMRPEVQKCLTATLTQPAAPGALIPIPHLVPFSPTRIADYQYCEASVRLNPPAACMRKRPTVAYFDRQVQAMQQRQQTELQAQERRFRERERELCLLVAADPKKCPSPVN